ncbi:MAG: GNAT family N-acetyltransferase [bacterium]|nr:GNAT family N-acetyltransferase [bacterium]
MADVLWNPDLKVRPMRPDELDEARRIGTRAFRQNFLDAYAGEETLVGETPEGRLVCCLSLVDRPLWWGKGRVPAASVGGVATLPTEQKKGYAGALMVGTVRHLRERGFCVSPLWPFSFAFYRKFGWEQTVGDLIARPWPEMLERLPVAEGEVRPATRDDIPALNRLHASLATAYNATSVRDEAWWTGNYARNDFPERCLVHLGGSAGAASAGEIEGYTIYRLQPNPQSQGLTIRAIESWAAAPRVLAALTRALGRLPGATAVHLILPADSLLPDLFPDRVPMDTGCAASC